MKKENITLRYDSEKLRAVRRYMDKKQLCLEDELAELLQKLYEKHVPANVREYIEEQQSPDSTPQ